MEFNLTMKVCNYHFMRMIWYQNNLKLLLTFCSNSWITILGNFISVKSTNYTKLKVTLKWEFQILQIMNNISCAVTILWGWYVTRIAFYPSASDYKGYCHHNDIWSQWEAANRLQEFGEVHGCNTVVVLEKVI